MDLLTEPEPIRDVVLPVASGISRIVAANPGPMTYFGTNTYLIDGADGTIVLDPGPDDHDKLNQKDCLLRRVSAAACPAPAARRPRHCQGCSLVRSLGRPARGRRRARQGRGGL